MRACLDAGLAVEVVPGPSAVLTALVLSGFPTDRFVFEGFLPRRGRERARAPRARSWPRRRTVVLFESPGRVAATLADLRERVRAAARGRRRPRAHEAHEEVWRGTLGDVDDLASAGDAARRARDRACARCPDARGERRRGRRARPRGARRGPERARRRRARGAATSACPAAAPTRSPSRLRKR